MLSCCDVIMAAFLQLFSLIFLICMVACNGKKVAMKVVEEPSNYGVNSYQETGTSNSLKMRVPPSNFSGPPHLHRLYGTCVEKVVSDYKYEFCPFVNVTQHEQSLRWNPYSGVLGVWQEWEISNNTFVAMLMREGDSCGSRFRSVRVPLRCGSKLEIDSVSEPSTCSYELVVLTPLVCHPHALLVYPTLPPNLQRRWDAIEGQLQADLITKQGYDKLLHSVFEEAGYVLSEEKQQQIQASIAEQAQGPPSDSEVNLDSLETCRTGYAALKQEVEALKTLLELHGIKNNVTSHNNALKKEPQYPEAPEVDYHYPGGDLGGHKQMDYMYDEGF